jgi:hypothetical protein
MPRSLRRQLIAATLAAASMAGPAPAAEIEIAPPITEALFTPYPADTGAGLSLQGAAIDFSAKHHIRLTGEIVEGDAQRLRDAIAALDLGDPDRFGTTILSMSSPGGNFSEALEIGDILTMRGIGTYVAEGDICLSACAFAFLGGNRMVTRNVYWEPWRHMHEGSTIGFHSPSLPGGVPRAVLDAVGEEVMFAEIARPTLENVRELQERADRWFLPSDFLFEILGRIGIEQFLFLENLEQTSLLRIIVVSAPRHVVPGLGVVEARTACEMVVREHLREFPFSTLYGGISLADVAASGLLGTSLSRLVETLPDINTEEAFRFEMLLQGFGTYDCQVETREGGYRAIFPGGIFEGLPSWGTETLADGRVAFMVHPHGVIGHGLPWSAIGAEDLALKDRDELHAEWPAGFHELASSYDFCNPRNPETWDVICRFDAVHDAVKMLTAVVETHRTEFPEAAETYIAWREDVHRYCRPEAGAGEVRETMLGYCALAVTLRQLDRAAALWLAGGE